MSKEEYRALSEWEMKIIDRLLEEPFSGRDEIREQVRQAKVRTISEYKDNYGSIEFKVSSDAKANVNQRVPVEAEAKDKDGVGILFLLHVVNSLVNELEIIRGDGQPMKNFPDPDSLVVKVRKD